MTNTGKRPAMLRAGGEDRGAPELTAASGILFADVSEWQPDVADATYLAWSKAVGIRALFGAQHDDRAWFGGARRDALHAGGARVVLIYQYLVAGQDGGAQARAFHALVGQIRPGEIFVADFEQGSHAMLAAWYNEMLTLYGKDIAPYLWTYSGLDFGLSNGAMPVQWLADYTSREPSQGQVVWQFSQDYPVPGVGRCDCNLFRGSIDQLAALAYQEPKPGGQPFGPVTSLRLAGTGADTVNLTWDSPAVPVAGEAVGGYQVALSAGTVLAAELPSFPHLEAKTANPQAWEGCGLKPATTYTAGVRAVDTKGGNAGPWVIVTFKTAAS